MNDTIKIEITANLPPETIQQIAEQCAKIMQNKKPEKFIDYKKKYALKEVANILQKDKSTIQRHCDKGLLKAEREGSSWVTTLPDIKEYLEHRKSDSWIKAKQNFKNYLES